METIVRATDPYFGQYYSLNIMPDVTWFLGPCATQTLRTGNLWSGGTVARTGSTKEKVVSHRGVSGQVRASDGPTAFHVSPISGDSWSWDSNIGGGFVLHFENRLTRNSEDRNSLTLTARVDRTGFYLGRPDPSWNKWAEMVLLFKKTTDPYTHNVTYTFVKSLARRGNRLAWPPEAAPTGCPYGTPLTGPRLSQPSARYWLDRTLGLYTSDLTKERAARDEAIYRALESLSVTNFSWLENFSDATAPLDGIRRLYDAFSSGPHWVRALRGMASLKLFWDYVVQNGIMDYGEAKKLVSFLQGGRRLDGLGAFGYMTCRGSASFSRSGDGWSEGQEWHAKVVLSPGWGPFSSLAELQLLGILPTAGSIWDLIPFSFVVDWVLPVGRMLSRGEKLVATLSCPLMWIVVGRKATINYNKFWTADDGHRITCALTEVRYDRNVIHHLPSGVGQLCLKNPLRHSLNGAALVIQQLL